MSKKKADLFQILKSGDVQQVCYCTAAMVFEGKRAQLLKYAAEFACTEILTRNNYVYERVHKMLSYIVGGRTTGIHPRFDKVYQRYICDIYTFLTLSYRESTIDNRNMKSSGMANPSNIESVHLDWDVLDAHSKSIVEKRLYYNMKRLHNISSVSSPDNSLATANLVRSLYGGEHKHIINDPRWFDGSALLRCIHNVDYIYEDIFNTLNLDPEELHKNFSWTPLQNKPLTNLDREKRQDKGSNNDLRNTRESRETRARELSRRRSRINERMRLMSNVIPRDVEIPRDLA